MDVKFDQYNNMYAVCRNSGTIQKYPSGNYNSSSKLEFVKITGRQIQAIAFDAAGNLIAAATDGSNAGYIYKVGLVVIFSRTVPVPLGTIFSRSIVLKSIAQASVALPPLVL